MTEIFISDNGLVSMTIDLYKNIVANMIPTPAKIHYMFNLRDISKVRDFSQKSYPQNETRVQKFIRGGGGEGN